MNENMWFTIGWVVWLLFFAVLEGIAIYRAVKYRQPGGTLTEHVRYWFATERNAVGPGKRTRRFLLIALLAWMAIHFLTNGFV